MQLDRVQARLATGRAARRVLAGAVGPRTLRLVGGQLADGTILTGGTTPDRVGECARLIDAGRADGGRTGPQPSSCTCIAATGAGRAAAHRRRVAEVVLDPRPGGRRSRATSRRSPPAVRRWAEAGADTVVLQPTVDEPDLEGFIKVVAEDVAPLVGADAG